MRGKLSSQDFVKYVLAQLIAGLFAGYLTLYLKGYPDQIPTAYDTIPAFISEFLFTFALCYVVLNVALAKGTKGNSFYGLAIGFTVLAGAYACGAVSGAAFNPAVAFGISVMQLSAWSNLGMFFAANFLGGLCAALVFKKAEASA